jgi:hypothetical protein
MGWQDAPAVDAGAPKAPAWASAPPVGGPDSTPSAAPPAPSAKPEPSLISKALDAAKGAYFEVPAALATGMVGAGGANVVGAGTALASPDRGTPKAMEEGRKAGEKFQEKVTYQPKTDFARSVLSGIATAFDDSKLGGLAPHMGLGTVPGARVASKAAGEVADAGKAAAAAPGRALAAALPVDADVAKLARAAQERWGIPLRPDQLTDNKIVRMVGEALEKVPASGSQAAQRQEAFNRGIGSLIGAQDAKRITPDVFDRAMTRSGETIGEISKSTPIPLASADTAGLDGALTAFVANAERSELADVGRVVKNYADELRRMAVNDVVPGDSFRKWNTDLGKRIRRAEGDLKVALSDLQEVGQDALERNIADPATLERLQTARREYAIGKAIEPMVAKSPNGDLSPAGLMQVVTATKDKKAMMARGRGGDLGELAKIGQMFLKEPSSSGTTERAVAYGLIGGGAAIDPTTAGTVYAGANLYNRAGPALARRMTRLSDGELPVVPVAP